MRYIDRDAFHALTDPGYAKHILGEEIDTGLTPEQTIRCLVEHEGDEKVILDADNPIDGYEGAHEMATAGEHEKVRQFGGSPIKYERGLKKIIAFCEKKNPENPPHDLACAPYLDDPDANDKRALKVLQAKGVQDAFKQSKNRLLREEKPGEPAPRSGLRALPRDPDANDKRALKVLQAKGVQG